MTMAAERELPWRTATASQSQSQCVEVAKTADGNFVIRNSKRPSGPQVSFTREEWEAFLDGAKKKEFEPDSW